MLKMKFKPMNKHVSVIVLFTSILCITACNKTEQTTTTLDDVPTKSKVISDQFEQNDTPANQVASSSLPYQKPGAAVRLITTQALQVDRGQDKEVIFVFTSSVTSGQLKISVKPSEGLAVDNLLTNYIFELPQQSVTLPLTIQGLVEGEQTMSFVAELNGKARSMGVLVWVGDVPVETTSPQQKSQVIENTPLFITLPAQETVKMKE